MTAQHSIQKVLNEELVNLKLKNPSYSLRAFARKLGITPSALSEVLNGKRNISGKLAERLADRLMLDPEKKQNLLMTFSQEKRRQAAASVHGSSTQRASIQLGMDHFKTVSDWYHFAILSLAETKTFRSDPAWIAKRLGLSKSVVTAAIERLLRLEMLNQDESGQLRPTGVGYTTSDEIANVSLRKSHAQNLELARASLEHDEVTLRDFTAITVSIDPAKIPEAKKMIRKFRDDLATFLESDEKSEVYKFCMQLIPLTKTQD
ncbi:MAG: hypothetical protein A2X94_10125 [Bdellovibrionales bacterium GWB1_55_8]|nr:MAG: hypothetical protein A2X94_10125 [Bdellovibrionales bacterium GWB1_55_8]